MTNKNKKKTDKPIETLNDYFVVASWHEPSGALIHVAASDEKHAAKNVQAMLKLRKDVTIEEVMDASTYEKSAVKTDG
jgi:hypothetical protein